tara:strand:- start:376 stop:1185 length:810 start_codon:yes stop_codon:yes gene_type:complete
MKTVVFKSSDDLYILTVMFDMKTHILTQIKCNFDSILSYQESEFSQSYQYIEEIYPERFDHDIFSIYDEDFEDEKISIENLKEKRDLTDEILYEMNKRLRFTRYNYLTRRDFIIKYFAKYINKKAIKCLNRKKREARCYLEISTSFPNMLPAFFIQRLYHDLDKKLEGVIKRERKSVNPSKEEIIQIFEKLSIHIDFEFLKNYIITKSETRTLLKPMKCKYTNQEKISKRYIIDKLETMWNTYQNSYDSSKISIRDIPLEIHKNIIQYV